MSQHRCLCTFHKCKDGHTADGERGVLLNLRKYRLHQEQEQQHKNRASVEEAQSRAIRDQEEAMTTAMSSLSVSASQGRTEPSPDKYRVEHVRRLVSSISALKDQASSLREGVRAIGVPASTMLYRDEIVQDKLQGFDSSRRRAKEMLQQLVPTNRGEYRRDASVRAIREQTTQALQEVLQLIGTYERPWKNILLQRQASRAAFLADGGVEYDCGE
jgi:hypothetical protein